MSSSSVAQLSATRDMCLQYLHQQVESLTNHVLDPKTLGLDASTTVNTGNSFMIPPFSIPLGKVLYCKNFVCKESCVHYYANIAG